MSGIDAVYTARIRNEYCVVAFRGTTESQENASDDFGTNLDVDPVRFDAEVASEDWDADPDCDVHSGYSDAYVNFEYRSGVEDFLKTCSEECPDCDVVLTGHSQGGGIAQIAALYYKKAAASEPENLYVINFGAPPALGAGCLPLFTNEERCRIYSYAMTLESPVGRGLVYDPVPMVYPRALSVLSDLNSDTYARHGGLAFLGHELFLNADDPSALALGPLGGHYGAGADKYDVTTLSHRSSLYVKVLEGQHRTVASKITTKYTDYECYLPTNGFSLGSKCNRDESDLHCAAGISKCKRKRWWWWSENACQAIDDSSIQSAATDRFCHWSPFEWTMVPPKNP